jgi:hypothetical protein
VNLFFSAWREESLSRGAKARVFAGLNARTKVRAYLRSNSNSNGSSNGNGNSNSNSNSNGNSNSNSCREAIAERVV